MSRWLLLSLVVVVGCSDDGRNKTAPDTALVEFPDALSNDRHVRILFEAHGNANGFFCTLDGQTSPCISPFEADVQDGEHAFAVAAALNDNIDETPATHAWRIDSVAPDTQLTSAPPTLDNTVAPVFEFMSPDDTTALFECAVDEGAFSACSSPHTVNSADGLHTFQVRARDAAGNIDATPAIHGWTIDATAPDTMITTGPAAGATTGPSGSFAFTSNDTAATFECSLDAGAFAACTSPRAFTLGNGAHTFSVRAKDQVGISDPTPAMRAWTVDAVAPPVAITSTPANPTNVVAPMFAFTSTDPTATFECQIDGVVTFTACTSPWAGPTVTDGSRTFRVRATDPVGNVGTPATHTWVVDTVPPSLAFTAQPAALSNDTTPSASFTAGNGAVSTECRVDAGNFAACTSPFTAGVTGDGAHTITVRAFDAATNAASITTATFTIDTVAPTVAFTALPTALSNDTTPTVAFTTAGGAVTIECRVDAGGFGACTSPHTATVGQGSHTFGVRVTDAATNSAIFTTTAFTVDTTPPAVTITTAPAALSNNKNPSVAFTTDGTSPTCQLDAAAPVACTSPHQFANVADGSHTITVRAVDGAGNSGSATTGSFTVDTVGPALAFLEQAPAAWPVNYFDFTFTVGDSTTVQCAIDAGAFAACASAFTATVSYGAAHTVSVRGTDSAGNQTTITSGAFTPTAGLVLHYPWEQGSTENTSLLRQRPSHSPNGATDLATFVGGWAGSALGATVASHTYAKTQRVLSSSPNGHYTASFWIRPTGNANGTILSTATATNGLRIQVSGRQLLFTALENGQSAQFTGIVPPERWIFVSVRTTGPGTPLDVFIDGNLAGSLAINGFVAGQAALTVGNWGGTDIDDLRFYNRSFSNDEHCVVLGRGFKDANGGCHPLAPGFEIDFEGTVIDTGVWNLALAAPTGGFALTAHTLGQLFRLTTQFSWGFAAGGPSLLANLAGIPGRSLSFEFVPGPAFGQIIDMRAACDAQTGGGGLCGLLVSYLDNGQIQIYTGTPSQQKTTVITTGIVSDKFNNVVITEQKSGAQTAQLTVYVNGKTTVIPITGGDIYARVRDDVRFVQNPNLFVDEYEFWPADLSKNAESLCENGFDSEFDPASGGCVPTYGP